MAETSGETAATFDASGTPATSIESPIQLAQLGAAQSRATGQQIDIGKVTKIEGQVSVRHPDGSDSALSLDARVFQGDTVNTSDNSAITITFVDGTTFALGGNATMVLDQLVYDANTQSGSSLLSVVQGTFVFLTGQIAASGPDAMKVATPAGTIGIRGTKVGCVVEAGSPATTCVNLPKGPIVPEEGATVTQQEFGSWVFVNEAATILVSAPNQAIVAFDRISTPITSVLSADEIQSLFGTLGLTQAGPDLKFALSSGGVLIEPELGALLFDSRGAALSPSASTLNSNGSAEEVATGSNFVGPLQIKPSSIIIDNELGDDTVTLPKGGEIVGIVAPSMTSGGVPVVIQQVGPTEVRGVLQTTGEVVFVFTINTDTGATSFTENLPLDHPIAGVTGIADAIDIIFKVEFTDNALNITPADVNVSVIDDGPAAVAGADVVLDESNTVAGDGDLVTGTNLLLN
ncbi:MAG: FecR domain-containing protein, partial [Alphaproteobacteria bacterium]